MIKTKDGDSIIDNNSFTDEYIHLMAELLSQAGFKVTETETSIFKVTPTNLHQKWQLQKLDYFGVI